MAALYFSMLMGLSAKPYSKLNYLVLFKDSTQVLMLFNFWQQLIRDSFTE